METELQVLRCEMNSTFYQMTLLIDGFFVGNCKARVCDYRVAIEDLFVEEKHRRKGYAKLMLNKAFEIARQHNKCCSLWVEEDNEGAINLYQSMGFKFCWKNDELAMIRFEGEK